MTLDDLFAATGLALEAVGVVVILAGSLLSAGRAVLRLRGVAPGAVYRELRRDLGRAIILGLEFLIAGDIIRTVVVAESLSSVAVLGLIIVIRSLLSVTLFVETENRWPWQSRRNGAAHATGPRHRNPGAEGR